MSLLQIEGIALSRDPNPVLITGTVTVSSAIYVSPQLNYQSNLTLVGLGVSTFLIPVPIGKIGKLISVVCSGGSITWDIKANGVTVATLATNQSTEKFEPAYGTVAVAGGMNYSIVATSNVPITQSAFLTVIWDET